MTLAERLREAMDSCYGMTNAKLARAIGVTPTTIGQWMAGDTRNPKHEHLWAAARVLNVSARWLALGEGPRDPRPVVRDPTGRYVAEVDASILADVIEAVETWPHAADLAPPQRAALIAELYLHHAKTGDDSGPDLARAVAAIMGHRDK